MVTAVRTSYGWPRWVAVFATVLSHSCLNSDFHLHHGFDFASARRLTRIQMNPKSRSKEHPHATSDQSMEEVGRNEVNDEGVDADPSSDSDQTMLTEGYLSIMRGPGQLQGNHNLNAEQGETAQPNTIPPNTFINNEQEAQDLESDSNLDNECTSENLGNVGEAGDEAVSHGFLAQNGAQHKGRFVARFVDKFQWKGRPVTYDKKQVPETNDDKIQEQVITGDTYVDLRKCINKLEKMYCPHNTLTAERESGGMEVEESITYIDNDNVGSIGNEEENGMGGGNGISDAKQRRHQRNHVHSRNHKVRNGSVGVRKQPRSEFLKIYAGSLTENGQEESIDLHHASPPPELHFNSFDFYNNPRQNGLSLHETIYGRHEEFLNDDSNHGGLRDNSEVYADSLNPRDPRLMRSDNEPHETDRSVDSIIQNTEVSQSWVNPNPLVNYNQTPLSMVAGGATLLCSGMPPELWRAWGLLCGVFADRVEAMHSEWEAAGMDFDWEYPAYHF